MAVSFTATRLFEAPIPSPDRRFPIRRWTVSRSAVGDASGNPLTFVQQFLTSRTSGLIYSIEALECFCNGNSGNGDITYQNWRRFTTSTTPTSGHMFFMNISTSPNEFMEIDKKFNPLILGRRGTNSASMEIRFSINTLGATYGIYLWGYVWRPGSFLEGGLLRPGDYPYPIKIP